MSLLNVYHCPFHHWGFGNGADVHVLWFFHGKGLSQSHSLWFLENIIRSSVWEVSSWYSWYRCYEFYLGLWNRKNRYCPMRQSRTYTSLSWYSLIAPEILIPSKCLLFKILVLSGSVMEKKVTKNCDVIMDISQFHLYCIMLIKTWALGTHKNA